ncbi:MAG: glutathione S-transferase N-terminal domain-containing protein [Alphaproteobacteria bacterium]|nr:glutathione S-transferase N-terminal domain-containing protein [Alphaproteobacteria bacterium]
MIDLYTWTTPNGRKISIMLEECGLPYAVKPVNIRTGEQFAESFVRISPNGKIPAIVDTGAEGGPLAVFESGAILIYLAEKSGRFLPSTAAGRARVLEWLMFQMGGIGPIFGQANHFANVAPEKIPYAIDRFQKESLRLLSVMDRRLGEAEFIAGGYSIADIALYPWVAAAFPGFEAAAPDIAGGFRGLKRWLGAVKARPAVAKGMGVPAIPVI